MWYWLFMCICSLVLFLFLVFFFKQKTAYEMRISDWSSDVCSSDLDHRIDMARIEAERAGIEPFQRARSLEHAAIDKHARLAEHEFMAGTGHRPRGDRKSVV